MNNFAFAASQTAPASAQNRNLVRDTIRAAEATGLWTTEVYKVLTQQIIDSMWADLHSQSANPTCTHYVLHSSDFMQNYVRMSIIEPKLVTTIDPETQKERVEDITFKLSLYARMDANGQLVQLSAERTDSGEDIRGFKTYSMSSSACFKLGLFSEQDMRALAQYASEWEAMSKNGGAYSKEHTTFRGVPNSRYRQTLSGVSAGQFFFGVGAHEDPNTKELVPGLDSVGWTPGAFRIGGYGTTGPQGVIAEPKALTGVQGVTRQVNYANRLRKPATPAPQPPQAPAGQNPFTSPAGMTQPQQQVNYSNLFQG